MAIVKIIQKGSKLALRFPHKIWINNQCIGIMKTPEIGVNMPEGRFLVTIQSMFPFLYASAVITTNEAQTTVIEFQDREKWWDILFGIDIILWFADLFVDPPHPWGLIYKIFTNGYFILWLIYEWRIRKNYFKIGTYYSINPSQPLQDDDGSL